VNDSNQKISDKLDILIKLTALNIIKDIDYSEQVKLLSSIGLQPKDIAELLGKTSNSVRVTLSRIRKRKNTNKKA